jgi:hypothetical protein
MAWRLIMQRDNVTFNYPLRTEGNDLKGRAVAHIKVLTEKLIQT